MMKIIFLIFILILFSCKKETYIATNNYDSIDNFVILDSAKNTIINTDNNIVFDSINKLENSILQEEKKELVKTTIVDPEIYKYNYQSTMEQIHKNKLETTIGLIEANRWNNRPDYSSQVLEEYHQLENKINNSKPDSYNNYVNPNHNPELIDVKEYQKANGTVVKEHIRTKANNTIKDNLRY